MKEGRTVDRARLPLSRVLSVAPPVRAGYQGLLKADMREHRRLFWTAAWLAVVLVAIKAYYLGAPAAPTLHAAWDYVRDLAAVSFVDVLFAARAVGLRPPRRCGSPAIGPASDRAIVVVVAAVGGGVRASTRWPASSSSACSAAS